MLIFSNCDVGSASGCNNAATVETDSKEALIARAAKPSSLALGA